MKQMRIFFTWLALLYLGLHNSYLALWETGSSVPEQVFPYSMDIYTEQDRKLLTDGITIHSAEEMSKLLEDYFS